MTVTRLAVFFLASYGAANAVAVLKVGEPLRRALDGVRVLGKLVRCVACLSFWTGFALTFWLHPAGSLGVTVGDEMPARTVVALASSAFSYLLHVAAERVRPEKV